MSEANGKSNSSVNNGKLPFRRVHAWKEVQHICGFVECCRLQFLFCGHYAAWKANTKANAKDKANDWATVKAVPNIARCTDDDDNDDDATWWPVAHCRLGSINNLGHDPAPQSAEKAAAAAAATGQNLLPLVTLANTHAHVHVYIYLKPLCESHIIDLP